MIDRPAGVACAAVAACTALSATVPVLHPLIAYAGLAGAGLGAATALDDEAGAVTAATPRSARQQVLSRVVRAAAPLAVWQCAAVLIDRRDPTWPLAFSVTIALCVTVAAFGAAALARKHGVATPGETVGTGAGAIVLAMLLGGPSIRGISPFGPLPAALWWWLPLLGAGIGALVAGTRDPMLSPRHSRAPATVRGHL